MKTRYLIILILVSLLLLSCTVTIPVEKVEVSDSVNLLISEPLPDVNQPSELSISMAGGQLDISAGSDQWVEGNIEYNVPLWQPEITRTENKLEISQKLNENVNISDRVINKWALELGSAPMDITVRAGAYESKLNLGGVPVTNLDVSDGASNVVVTFDEPNPVVMEKLRYRSGASNIEFSGLGNANFKQMHFEGGAGSYTFDFTGQQQQDANVEIRGGAGSFELIIPADTPVTVTLSKALGEVELEGTWTIDGQQYSAEGTGPKLHIDLNLSLGKLTLIKK